jgi:hypothetical protein
MIANGLLHHKIVEKKAAATDSHVLCDFNATAL